LVGVVYLIWCMRKNPDGARAKGSPVVTDIAEPEILNIRDELTSPIFPASSSQMVSARVLRETRPEEIGSRDVYGEFVTEFVTADGTSFDGTSFRPIHKPLSIQNLNLPPTHHTPEAPHPPPRTFGARANTGGSNHGMNPDSVDTRSPASPPRFGSEQVSPYTYPSRSPPTAGEQVVDTRSPTSPPRFGSEQVSPYTYRSPPPPTAEEHAEYSMLMATSPTHEIGEA